MSNAIDYQCYGCASGRHCKPNDPVTWKDGDSCCCECPKGEAEDGE